jgi:hypothetical protein
MRRPARRLLEREPIFVAQDQDRVGQLAALISIEPEQLVHPDVVVDAQPIHALNPPVAHDKRGRQALCRSGDVDAWQHADGQPAHLPLEGGVQPDGRGQDPFADGPGEVHPQVFGKALAPRIAAPVAERAHLVEHVDEREHQAGIVSAREVAVQDVKVPARRPAIGLDARGTHRVTAFLRVVEGEDPCHQVGHHDGGIQRQHVTLRRHEQVEPRGAESLVVGLREELLLPRPSTMFLLKLGLARMPSAAQRTMHRCDEVVAPLVVVNLEDDGAVGVDHRWVGLGRRRGGVDGSLGSAARCVAWRTLLRRSPQRGRRSGRRGREAARVGGRGAEPGGSTERQAGLVGGRVRAYEMRLGKLGHSYGLGSLRAGVPHAITLSSPFAGHPTSMRVAPGDGFASEPGRARPSRTQGSHGVPFAPFDPGGRLTVAAPTAGPPERASAIRSRVR